MHWWGSSRVRLRPSPRSSSSTAMLQHCLVLSPRDSAVGGSSQGPAVAWRQMGCGWAGVSPSQLSWPGTVPCRGKNPVSALTLIGEMGASSKRAHRHPPAPPGCPSAAQPHPTQPALTREQQEQNHCAQVCELHAPSRVSCPTALLFCRLPRGSQLLLRQPQCPHFLSATPFLWVAM